MNDGQVLQQILFFALLVGGLYLLAIRPQRARARALAEVRSGLAPGAAVVTTAGIHATVRAVEDGTVVLEIAPGVLVRFADAAVVRILSPDVDDSELDESELEDAELEDPEAAHPEAAHPDPTHPDPTHPDPTHPEPAHPELRRREPQDAALGDTESDRAVPGGAGPQSSAPQSSAPQPSAPHEAAPQEAGPQEPGPQEPGPPTRRSRRRPQGPGAGPLGGDRP